jgi:hypothetical protein
MRRHVFGSWILALGFLAMNLAVNLPATTKADAPPAPKYVASKLRKPFHLPDCKWALKISPENLETFDSREAAIAAGHVPCKVCNP